MNSEMDKITYCEKMGLLVKPREYLRVQENAWLHSCGSVVLITSAALLHSPVVWHHMLPHAYFSSFLNRAALPKDSAQPFADICRSETLYHFGKSELAQSKGCEEVC